MCECFAIQFGDIIVGDYLYGYRGGRAKPEGMYIYKPTKRKYDYVDYTGRFKNKVLDFNDITCVLEFLGYIKFVESTDGE